PKAASTSTSRSRHSRCTSRTRFTKAEGGHVGPPLQRIDLPQGRPYNESTSPDLRLGTPERANRIEERVAEICGLPRADAVDVVKIVERARAALGHVAQ